jgi:hypothetical protein
VVHADGRVSTGLVVTPVGAELPGLGARSASRARLEDYADGG